MLELYQFEECPYCARVRAKLTDLGMSYIIHNVPRNREDRTELEKISGQKFVPVLVDKENDVIIADDDEKKKKGRDTMVYGAIGLFFIVSIWGIVGLLQDFTGAGAERTPDSIPTIPTS